jgi:hypothetical protein
LCKLPKNIRMEMYMTFQVVANNISGDKENDFARLQNLEL